MKKRLNTIIAAVALLLIINACSAPSPETTHADITKAPVTSAADTTAADTSQADTAAAADTTAADITPDVVFTTTDLDGNTVDSAELFSSARLTMINIWGTFCGPCIGEMPGLEELSGRLKGKGCAIVGIVCDTAGPDDPVTADAEDIISDTGVTYQNLFPWNTFIRDLPAMYIPTSYFIDSDGRIIGEAAVGARDADAYEEIIDSILEGLEER